MGTKALRAPDGTIYDVPESDVGSALADGYKESDVLIAPDGGEYDVPVSDVESALADGYKRPGEQDPLQAGLPLPQDVQDAGSEVLEGVKEEAPGWGASALAATQGLTRYLGGDVIREGGRRLVQAGAEALGADPAVAAEYNPFQTREQVLANKEASPTAAVIGETAGLVGSAFIPTAGLAKALPAVGINAAGAATAAKVVAKLAPEGAGLIRTALAKTVGIAAQGATEAALQGAASEVNDAFLRGDYTKLAEKLPARLLDDAKTGALWSVGTAGVLKAGKLGLKVAGLAGKGVRAAGEYVGDVAATKANQGITRAEQDLAAALDSEAEQVITARAARAAEDAALDAERVTVQNAEDVATSIDSRAAQLARRQDDRVLTLTEKAAGDIQYKDAVKSATQAIKRDQDELLTISEHFDEHANRGSKQFQNKELNGWGAALRDPAVNDVVQGIGVGAREMLEGHGAIAHQIGGGTAALKRAADLSNAFDGAISKDLAAGNVGDAFNKADDLKLLLGKLKNSRDAAVSKFAADHYDKLRLLLENEDMFGPLAQRQKVFNAALSKQISAEQADGLSSLFIDTGKKNASNSWLNAEGTNDEGVQALLGKLGTGVTYQEDAYRGFLGALDGSLSARAEALQNPALIERAKRARELTRNIANQMDNVTRLRRGADEWAAAKSAAELTPTIQIAGFGIDGKAALKGAHTTALARLNAAEAAVTAGRVARETAAEKTARELAKAQQQVTHAAENGKLWRAASDYARGASKAGASLSKGAAAAGRAVDKAAETVRRAAVLGTVQSVLESADRLSDPSTTEHKDLQSRLQEMEKTVGPELTQAYAARLDQRNAFLLKKAGPAPTPSMFGGSPKREIDGETAESISRYLDAVDEPLAAVKRVADGESNAEDMEVLSTMYTGLLSEFREKAVANLAARKEPMEYEQQLAVAEALGLPLTPEQQPESAQFWQGLARAQTSGAEAKPPSGRMMKFRADGTQSKADRIG